MSYGSVETYTAAPSAAVLATESLATTPSDRARVQIDKLQSLKPGWNGHRARVPTRRALINAKNVARHLPVSSIDEMSVVPTNQGGVQLEWHAGGVDVEIEVTADGSVECVIDDPEDGVEVDGPIHAHWLAIHQALRHIG